MANLLELEFILTQAANVAFLLIIQYANGILVIKKNVRVNYTRKINHFLLFFIPIFLNRGYIYAESFELFTMGAFLAVFKFIFYIKPIRERVSFINVMFHSFDRPEDRPYTLLWIVTQTAAGYAVLIPMSLLFANNNIFHLILIPILVYGIGDGLAEPVGVRFGRIRYNAYALFTNRKYFRTIEGSAVVFLTSLVVVLFYASYFSQVQFIAALIAIPVGMTLAEAFSPHTWDSPIMFFVGYMILFGVKML